MKLRSVILFAASLFIINNSFAQHFSLKHTSWTIGLSDHIVVDGGKETRFPFETKAWNYMPFPTRATVEAYFMKGWSFQTELAYTQYKTGNIMDNVAITKAGTYFGFDFNGKFAMSHWTNKPNGGWFDPYLTLGYGYTLRTLATNKNTANHNLGIGCNFWIYKGFGLNLQGLGKFAMKGGAKSNYTHYSVSLLYKIKSKSDKMGTGK